MLYITAIRMSGGTQHAHVAEVRWLNGATGVSKTISTAGMVTFLEEREANKAQVGGEGGPAYVGVVHPKTGKPYLRTHADGNWNDNLLALPRY